MYKKLFLPILFFVTFTQAVSFGKKCKNVVCSLGLGEKVEVVPQVQKTASKALYHFFKNKKGSMFFNYKKMPRENLAFVEDYISSGDEENLKASLNEQMKVQKIHLMPKKDDILSVVKKLLIAFEKRKEKSHSCFSCVRYFKVINSDICDRYRRPAFIVVYLHGDSVSDIAQKRKNLVLFLEKYLKGYAWSGKISSYSYWSTYNLLVQFAENGSKRKRDLVKSFGGKEETLGAFFDKKYNYACFLPQEKIIENLKNIRRVKQAKTK